ncbi:MAG: AAA-type ATPase lid domain-containing protein [Planctomycetota bacterium]|jgi:DNA-binding NtrC family response regulator
MAKARTIATELAKLLNAAAQPVYVLDDEQTIVFSNKACLKWVGRAAEELHGRKCAYHSSAEARGAGAALAGLCPAPEALAGEVTEGTVARVAADGRLVRRRARFVRIADDTDDTVGLIVVVDLEDLPQSGSSTLDEKGSEAAWLHERLRAFRHEAVARLRIDRLVGDSPAIRQARAQVALAVESRASVLIVGPPGSGRQHVAGVIHYGGHAEPAGSLVPLACSVLGAELIQSTVASLAAQRPSEDHARPATLVLNGADQLPREVQSELAAVLGSRSFPLRLIATARQSLGDLARRGEYGRDLAAVLSTITIELPPLADRREDIPLLAQLFVEEENARGDRQLAGFSPEALDRLDAYAWPGNVDELAQMVAEAHRQAEGVRIDVGTLPGRIHLAADAAAHPRRAEETVVLDEFLARIERELIRRALGQAKGNKTKAAKLLGMTRPRLYRRLVQLGLEE